MYGPTSGSQFRGDKPISVICKPGIAEALSPLHMASACNPSPFDRRIFLLLLLIIDSASASNNILVASWLRSTAADITGGLSIYWRASLPPLGCIATLLHGGRYVNDGGLLY